MTRWLATHVSTFALTLALTVVCSTALGQPPAVPLPSPKLTSMAPLGLQAGTTATIVFAGTDLAGVDTVHFAEPRLSGRIVKSNPPTLSVTADKALPPGLYDVRLASPRGITNPLPIVVGLRPEVAEVEPNDDVPQAQKIRIGTTINGTIGKPTDVDYVSFEGTAGQTIHIDGAANRIGTRAKPLLELIAPSGRRWSSGTPRLATEAHIDATLPEAGVYLLRICEFAYQTGGPEHGYRLTIDERPMQPLTLRTPIFALAGDGTSGMKSQRETNRPNDTPETAEPISIPAIVDGCIDRPGDVDWFRISARKNQPMMLELLAERIGSPIDAYMTIRDARTNKEIVNEERLDDDAESLHPIAFASRSLDPPPFRFDPPADGNYLIGVATRDGRSTFGPSAVYRLRIAPPQPGFRVIVMPRSREQPIGVTLRPGVETAVDVYVHRIDGYEGPVTVSARDLPPGVTSKPALIGTSQKWGVLLLRADSRVVPIAVTRTRIVAKPFAPERIFELKLQAQAAGSGPSGEIVPATISQAIPANANVPAATRLDQMMPVAVRNVPLMPGFSLQADLANVKGKDGKPITGPLAMKPGEKVTVPIQVKWTGPDRPAINLTLEPTHSDNQRIPFSGNNANTQIAIPKDKSEGVVTLELRPNAVPGRYRASIRGDAAMPVRIEGKPVNSAIPAWVGIDLTVLPK